MVKAEEEHEKDEMEEPKEEEEHEIDSRSAKQRESDERRLQSLAAMRSQKPSSFGFVKPDPESMKRSKRLVFLSDDEDEKAEKIAKREPVSSGKPLNPDSSTKLTGPGSSSLLWDETAADEDNDAARFSSKPHYAGARGDELMRLQTQINSRDERFQVDTRFADTPKTEDADTLAAERRGQMELLSSLVPAAAVERVQRQHRPVVASRRFDPALDRDAGVTVQDTSHEEANKVDSRLYYEVNAPLKEAFGSGTATFAFAIEFLDQGKCEQEEVAKAAGTPTNSATFKQMRGSIIKRPTFFFTVDDPRLAAGAEFRRKGTLNEVETRWQDKKVELKERALKVKKSFNRHRRKGAEINQRQTWQRSYQRGR